MRGDDSGEAVGSRQLKVESNAKEKERSGHSDGDTERAKTKRLAWLSRRSRYGLRFESGGKPPHAKNAGPQYDAGMIAEKVDHRQLKVEGRRCLWRANYGGELWSHGAEVFEIPGVDGFGSAFCR
jgi:hypothetical protein